MQTWLSFATSSGISMLAMMLMACGSSGSAGSQADETVLTSPSIVEEAERQIVHVSMGNMQFSPETITVRAGTPIMWTNDESVLHTVTAGDESWDSGVLKEGETYTVTFDTPGRYCYYCLLHPGHIGDPCGNAGVMSPLHGALVSLGDGGVPMQARLSSRSDRCTSF